MRILVLVDQMAIGGAGRVASIMLQGLIERGHKIMLVTDTSKGLLYHVPDEVDVRSFVYTAGCKGVHKRAYQFVRRIRGHRRYIKEFRPDAIVTYLPGMFTDALVANIGTGIPVIVSDHTAMSRDLGRWTNFVRHHLYGLASCATVLTKKDYRYLGKRVRCKEVLYNPLTFAPLSDNADEEKRKKTVLCVGRVSSWDVKGFDRIIRIWGSLAPIYPDWELEIAGPGEQKHFDKLASMAHEAGCSDSVKFLGNIKDIEGLYRQTSVFALPSRVEGFPMALIEAMSQGCACVSFDLDGAISEIANDKEDCLIVPDNDITSFTKALSRLIGSQETRSGLASQAIKNVARYSVTKYINHWEQILNRVTKK